MVSKSKKIVRIRKSTTFATVLSKPLRDKRLSLSAKGLYSTLVAYQDVDDWKKFYIDEIELESSLKRLVRYAYIDDEMAKEFKSKFAVTGKFENA